MSKKRFIEGLDSLFADSEDTGRQPAKATPARSKKRGRKKEETEPAKASGKDFSADLAAFLQEAFEESFEQQLGQQGEAPPAPKERPARSGKPASGLDALIRNTLEPAAVTIDPKATRRLVVTFREEQLQKLKSIARTEKTVLKKVINEIVEDYIRQYEREREQDQ